MASSYDDPECLTQLPCTVVGVKTCSYLGTMIFGVIVAFLEDRHFLSLIRNLIDTSVVDLVNTSS